MRKLGSSLLNDGRADRQKTKDAKSKKGEWHNDQNERTILLSLNIQSLIRDVAGWHQKDSGKCERKTGWLKKQREHSTCGDKASSGLQGSFPLLPQLGTRRFRYHREALGHVNKGSAILRIGNKPPCTLTM